MAKIANRTKRPGTPIMQDLDAPSALVTETFKRMTPPSGTFDAGGAWHHVYRDMSSFNRSAQGEVSLAHKPGELLHIESFRNCINGYRFYTIADLKCAKAGWRAPLSWTVETKVAKTAHASAYMNSGFTKKARVQDGELTIQEAERSRALSLEGDYNCKWCLMHSVGLLPGLGTKTVGFTLVDEYDEPCPGQRIRFQGKKRVKTKTGIIEVSCFQHTGTAMTPGVFYVDAAGRVLLYLAGMQMLGLVKAGARGTGI